MNSEIETAVESEALVAAPEPVVAPASPAVSEVVVTFQAHDFRNPTLISSREMRKLRLHQEEFVGGLTRRIAAQLRKEFVLSLTSLQTVTYQSLSVAWRNPSNLILFKLEPLRGVAVMEIRPTLALGIVDRLMGGAGEARLESTELSEIERVLLDQTVQIVLDEWCKHWSIVRSLKPVTLGFETNGDFIQTCTPDTVMFLVTLSATLGGITDAIQIGVPFAAMESLIREVAQEKESESPVAPVVVPKTTTWNAAYDEICIPVSAEWHGLEMSLGEIANLKAGDVIALNPEVTETVQICLEQTPRFLGRPGASGGKWAVELTHTVAKAQP